MNTRVSPESIRGAAGELQRVVDGFEDKVGAFEAELHGYGEAWGADDIGTLIGLAHGAALDAALTCFDTNITELEGAAEGLRSMAGTYAEADETAKQQVETIAYDKLPTQSISSLLNF